ETNIDGRRAARQKVSERTRRLPGRRFVLKPVTGHVTVAGRRLRPRRDMRAVRAQAWPGLPLEIRVGFEGRQRWQPEHLATRSIHRGSEEAPRELHEHGVREAIQMRVRTEAPGERQIRW